MIGMDCLCRGVFGVVFILFDLLKWYYLVGVFVIEGYGMIESLGVISFNNFENNKIGIVGVVLSGV